MRYFAAMRANAGVEQANVAKACGLSVATVANADRGSFTDKTARKLLAYYAGKGLQLALLPGGFVGIVWQGSEGEIVDAIGAIVGADNSRVLPTIAASTWRWETAF